LTPLLRRLLQAADRDTDICWGIDEMYTLGNWPAGSHEWLVKMGILKEIQPSGLVWLWECVDPDWVEPTWLPDARHDGRIMGFYACGNEWCGVHVLEHDRRRQWAPSIDGIVSAVAKALGGANKEVVPQRVWLVGTMNRDGAYRELFLLRGGGWPDAATMIHCADRLLRSPAPAVLALDELPPPHIWTSGKPPLIALSEITGIQDGVLHIDLQPLIAQLTARCAWDADGWLSVTEAAELLMHDLPGLELKTARARISAAANRGAFKTNHLKREQRRIEALSFNSWRLVQRDRDLDAEEDE